MKIVLEIAVITIVPLVTAEMETFKILTMVIMYNFDLIVHYYYFLCCLFVGNRAATTHDSFSMQIYIMHLS